MHPVQSDDFAKLAVRALAETVSDRTAGDSDDERLRAMVAQATSALKGKVQLPADEIEHMLSAVQSRSSPVAGIEVSRRQVSRWFEVHEDEFEITPIESLRPEVLFSHLYYERLIAGWFEEWGYHVDIGEELEGLEGADFIPDVYASLETLHGSFQVAVTLFCQPANTYRVLGMLENIEAFAPKDTSEFGERDIYLLVTPYKFLEQATNQIRVQSQQEDYSVVPIEFNELHDLVHAPDSDGRLERLHDMVESSARRKVQPR